MVAFRISNRALPEEAEQQLLSEDGARREFLKKAGKFAVVTPPAITLLLGTSLGSEAIAASSGGGPRRGRRGQEGPEARQAQGTEMVRRRLRAPVILAPAA